MGPGNVGITIAQTLISEGLPDELVLIGTSPNKLRVEMLDLQHASTFLPHTELIALVSYTVTVGFDI